MALIYKGLEIRVYLRTKKRYYKAIVRERVETTQYLGNGNYYTTYKVIFLNGATARVKFKDELFTLVHGTYRNPKDQSRRLTKAIHK